MSSVQTKLHPSVLTRLEPTRPQRALAGTSALEPNELVEPKLFRCAAPDLDSASESRSGGQLSMSVAPSELTSSVPWCDSAAGGGGARRGACGRAGILGEAAHDEGNEEQQPAFMRSCLLDADRYGSAAPCFAVEVR